MTMQRDDEPDLNPDMTFDQDRLTLLFVEHLDRIADGLHGVRVAVYVGALLVVADVLVRFLG